MGSIHIFRNTDSTSNPLLDGGEYIRLQDSFLYAGDRATPEIIDWNNDGKIDILAGNLDGTLKVYLNKGTDTVPVFGDPFLLQVNGRDFDIGSRSAPRVFDWNDDGLNDLFIGEMHGYVYYLKNVGSTRSPAFSKAEKLFLMNGDLLQYPDEHNVPRSRPFIVDWNNDGHNDIIVGGRDGRIILYLAEPDSSATFTMFLKRTWAQFKETLFTTRRLLDNLAYR